MTAREEAFEGSDDLNVGETTNWDVGSHGRGFLYIDREEGTLGFIWILHWPEILREREAEQP